MQRLSRRKFNINKSAFDSQPYFSKDSVVHNVLQTSFTGHQ